MARRGPQAEVTVRNERIEDTLLERLSVNPHIGSKERNDIFNELAESFSVSSSTIRSVYYKMKNTGKLGVELLSIPTKKDFIYLRITENNSFIRVVEKQTDEYFLFGQDLLDSLELQSSIYMNGLFTAEGVKKEFVSVEIDDEVHSVWVLPLSLAKRFLKQVVNNHTIAKVKSLARTILIAANKLVSDGASSLISREWDGDVGEIVPFTITHITQNVVYGKVATDRKHPVNASVHISQVTNGYVQDIHDYFNVDEVYEGQVLEFSNESKRLHLSTVLIYPFPIESSEQKNSAEDTTLERNNSISQEQAGAKLPGDTSAKKQSADYKNEKKEISQSKTTSISSNTVEEYISNSSLSPEFQKEVKQIISFLIEQTGIEEFSPAAATKLITLLKEEGLFKVSLGVTEVLNSPPPYDLGSSFLGEVREQLHNQQKKATLAL